MLEIKNLKVSIKNKEILKGLNLNVKLGEIHALIGPNGSGKTTLANALAGKEECITSGSAKLNKNELLSMSVTERARAGLFISFQTPPSIPGVTNFRLVSQSSKPLKISDLITKYKNDVSILNLTDDWGKRHFNDGASGGERKKNELLQLLQSNPKIVILDELDTGLDIDALKVVLGLIQKNQSKYGWIVISHSSRILKKLKPTYVHIINNGCIAECGGIRLLNKIEKEGFTNV